MSQKDVLIGGNFLAIIRPDFFALLVLDNMFHFTCFNVDDPDDPSVGLINGELAVPGNLLRREVFDPVVEQVSIFSLCRS